MKNKVLISLISIIIAYIIVRLNVGLVITTKLFLFLASFSVAIIILNELTFYLLKKNVLKFSDAKRNICFFMISFSLLTGTFYNNFTMGNSKYADNYFDMFSSSIMIADLNFRNNFSVDSPFMKVINPGDKPEEVFQKYIKNESYSYPEYLKYVNNITAHRYIYAYLDEVLTLSNQNKLQLFFFLNAVFFALFVSIFLIWLKDITDYVSAYITLFLISFCAPNFVMYGKNLYWAAGSMFLPIVTSIIVTKSDYLHKERKILFIPMLISFFSCLLKQLFYFEFITSIVISMMIPYIHFCILHKINFRKSLKIYLYPLIGSIASFFAASLIKMIMLYMDGNSIYQAVKVYFFPIIVRVIGDEGSPREPIVKAATAPFSETIKVMLNKPAFDYNNLFSISEIGIVILTLILTCAIVFLYYKKRTIINRKIYAGIICVWISILAPFSWFILAKPHVVIHHYQSSFLWFLPFTIIAVALSIHVILYLCKILLGMKMETYHLHNS